MFVNNLHQPISANQRMLSCDVSTLRLTGKACLHDLLLVHASIVGCMPCTVLVLHKIASQLLMEQ